MENKPNLKFAVTKVEGTDYFFDGISKSEKNLSDMERKITNLIMIDSEADRFLFFLSMKLWRCFLSADRNVIRYIRV